MDFKAIDKIQDKEDRLMLKKIIDQYLIHNKKNISTSSSFLNLRELTFVSNYLDYLNVQYQIYNPFDIGEKSIIYFGNYDDFISIYKIENHGYTHRDILGSLFNIGYTDDMIGDIFVNDDIYLTNLRKYDILLESSLSKIGKYNIKLEKLSGVPHVYQKFIDININLNSLRIDLLISKLTFYSRGKTLDFMKSKNIYVNYQKLKNISYNVSINDIISIQSVGKFIVSSISYNSKKGKYNLVLKKYD